MNRRTFVNKAKIISAGAVLVPSFLWGCEKNRISPPNNPQARKYIPKVNSPPYFGRQYHTEEKTSGSSGTVDAVFQGQQYGLFIEQENHNIIQGLEAKFYGDKKYGTKLFSIIDPRRKYLPNIYSFSNKKSLEYAHITMSGIEEGDILNGGLGSSHQNLFIKQIKEGLPSWNTAHMCEYPGMAYLGDWSFNNLKQLNTNLNRASLIITFIAPNPVSGAVFGFTSTLGKVLTGIDFAIDSIDAFTPLNIDENKQYPIYQGPVGDLMFVSLAEDLYCSRQSGDINTLLPLSPGNSWTYKDNYGNLFKWEAKGIKKINGKDLLFVKNVDGSEEYFGFNGKTLAEYGIYDSSVGGIFFDPALKIGDDNINIGTSYNVSSKLICEKHPEITGTVNGRIKCESKEQVVLQNNKPYGDCFRMSENSNLVIKKDNQENSLNTSAMHWFAKNVGKIKMTFNGQELDLVSSEVNSKSARDYSVMPSLPQKILESVKSLI